MGHPREYDGCKFFLKEKDSVLVVVVITVIPIAFRVPAMLVFIPPSMTSVPTPLPRFV
jgi:hypothetical protein